MNIMKLMNWDEAAQYCGLGDEREYFRGLVKGGQGPNYVKPSPRRIYFTAEHLDAWIKTWHTARKPA
jgi:hypothetical protein